MIKPKEMAKLLASKLTKEEFSEFAQMLDGDSPAGPFWEAVQDKNQELNPEDYSGPPTVNYNKKS